MPAIRALPIFARLDHKPTVWRRARMSSSRPRPPVLLNLDQAHRYSRAVISRVRTPSSSTYHSPMTILIAGNTSGLARRGRSDRKRASSKARLLNHPYRKTIPLVMRSPTFAPNMAGGGRSLGAIGAARYKQIDLVERLLTKLQSQKRTPSKLSTWGLAVCCLSQASSLGGGCRGMGCHQRGLIRGGI